MKVETDAEPNTEEFDARRCREVASHYVKLRKDHRLMITCECAMWGRPCPHYLWDDVDDRSSPNHGGITR